MNRAPVPLVSIRLCRDAVPTLPKARQLRQHAVLPLPHHFRSCFSCSREALMESLKALVRSASVRVAGGRCVSPYEPPSQRRFRILGANPRVQPFGVVISAVLSSAGMFGVKLRSVRVLQLASVALVAPIGRRSDRSTSTVASRPLAAVFSRRSIRLSGPRRKRPNRCW